jgi:hypothetical protein
MSEEDLELLVTLDNPEGAPEEDTFNHLSAENTWSIGWISRAARGRPDQPAEADKKNEVWKYRHRHFAL